MYGPWSAVPRGGQSFCATWPPASSNLYLRRRGDTLCLAIEHRAAPSRDGLVVELRAQGEALALHVVNGAPSSARVLTPPAPAPGERIEQALAEATTPLNPPRPAPHLLGARQHPRADPGSLARGRAPHAIPGRVPTRPLVARPVPARCLPTVVGNRNREPQAIACTLVAEVPSQERGSPSRTPS